jgi:hypothetical protein
MNSGSIPVKCQSIGIPKQRHMSGVFLKFSFYWLASELQQDPACISSFLKSRNLFEIIL